MRTIFGGLRAETTRRHIYTKGINMQALVANVANGNLYFENCRRVFSAMTGKLE